VLVLSRRKERQREEATMPKALEDKLKREAAERGYSKERTGAFVYGVLRKTGWKPKRERGADQRRALSR